MNNIKAVIFDWGRTLYDVENDCEFPDAQNIIEYCFEKKYRLALVSLVTTGESEIGTDLEKRNQQINNSVLKKYFEKIITTTRDKDLAFEKITQFLNLPAEQILIVDDRTIRGIRYGNIRGHITVWIKRGKFADELPNKETGQPTYTIQSLNELKNIL
jgi:FMN phosphatase YigB (HAD superfamily)